MNRASAYVALVVVVEDSDEDFDTLVDAAAVAGVTNSIHRAASGGDCLAMLRGYLNGGGEDDGTVHLAALPALILMDLNSHGVDGREALMAIKTDPSFKEIPLVILTTSSNPKDVAFCYQAGANAYHVKPVRHDQYLLLLRSILHYWLESVKLHITLEKVD